MAAKTNATRILDSLGIRYGIREYDVDPADLTAETVASKIGLPLEQVFKTLLVSGDRNGECFAVVPGHMQLDMKALARITGDRGMALVSLKEVEPLTGYVRGGVTVFGARKSLPAYVDESIELWNQISVSAGVRGMQVVLSPTDYIRAISAVLGSIAKA